MKIEPNKDYVEKVLATYKESTEIDYETGELMFGKMPIIWARAEFLYNIYYELSELIGDSANSILRRIGNPYGSSFYQHIKESGVVEKLARNENVYLYLCSENLVIGWGLVSVEEKDGQIIVISEPGLPVGRAFLRHGKKSQWSVDSYFLGYLEGLLSEMHGKEVIGEELECVAKGDDRCMMRFIITP